MLPRKPGKVYKRMRQGRSTGAPTKAQEARFAAIKEHGCIACAIKGMARYAEIHHLTVGGKHGQKRRGHDYTVGLCPWHHRGENTFHDANPEAIYGPSYAREPRRFREVFGQDDALLDYQNKLLGIPTDAAA